jgi:ABC-type transport system substrate-binding protein
MKTFKKILCALLMCCLTPTLALAQADELTAPLMAGESANPFLYEPLFDVLQLPDHSYQPRLALRYDLDGNSLSITLRPNLCWADGSPLTAQDAKASLYLDMLEGALLLKHVKSVETPSENQLVLRFETPAEPLLAACLDVRIRVQASQWVQGISEMDALLAQRSFDPVEGVYPLDQEFMNRLNVIQRPSAAPANSGYQIAEETAEHLLLTKNPRYIFADQCHFETVRLIKCDMESAYELACQGVFDVEWLSLSADQLSRLKDTNEAIVTLWSPNEAQPLLYLDGDIEQPVRQAIWCALDREAMLLECPVGVSGGDPYCTGLPAGWLPALSGEDFLTHLTSWGYDLVNTEDIMAEAGYSKNSDGVYLDGEGHAPDIRLFVDESAQSLSDCARVMLDSLNQAGIRAVQAETETQANCFLTMMACNRSRGPLSVYLHLQERGLLTPGEEQLLHHLRTSSSADSRRALTQNLMASLNQEARLALVAECYLPFRLHDEKLTGYPMDPSQPLRQLSGMRLLARLVTTGQLYAETGENNEAN